MIRKATASLLLWFMTVAIVTGQPGLSYCLCLETAFVGDCGCLEVPAVVVEQEMETSCCSDESCSEDERSVPDEGLEISSSCAGCEITISTDLGDFLGTTSAPPERAGDVLECPALASGLNDFAIAKSCLDSIHGIRGSPPSLFAASSVPLFVRHAEFLI